MFTGKWVVMDVVSSKELNVLSVWHSFTSISYNKIYNSDRVLVSLQYNIILIQKCLLMATHNSDIGFWTGVLID